MERRQAHWRMRRVLLSCGLSVLKDGSDDHDIPRFQGVILRGIDDYLLSPRQQIQHYVVIILMVLGHPNACNIVKHRGLSGVINSRLENLKAVITHERADGMERRQAHWRMRRVLLSCGLSVLKDGSGDHDIPRFQGVILRGIDDCLLSLRQQVQHNVVIILMLLGHPGEIPYGVAIPATKQGLSGLPITFCQLPIP